MFRRKRDVLLCNAILYDYLFTEKLRSNIADNDPFISDHTTI